MDDEPATRRRGAELENAILDASWDVLVKRGYNDFTFEAVAAAASTSRPVLYRRWRDRTELLIATLGRVRELSPTQIPDTGNLRDDIVGLLVNANTSRAEIVAVLSAQLTGFFTDTGLSIADLRARTGIGTQSSVEHIVERAAARRHVDVASIPKRVLDVPFDLFRHELLFTGTRVPRDVIETIVDDVWLPLLRQYGVPGDA